jgi:hypothetical protein
MKRGVYVFSVLILLSLGLTGCHYKKPITDEAKADLARPVNCSSALDNIKVLEAEKASSLDQLKAGAKMVVPAAAARTILHGDYIDCGEVLIGMYNSDIDKKIKEIKNTCGLSK